MRCTCEPTHLRLTLAVHSCFPQHCIGVQVQFERSIDVVQVEMLLEAYFMQVDNTCNKLQTLHEYIDDTEVSVCTT